MPDSDDIDTHYQNWLSDGTPESMGRVVKALKPNIGYALASLGAGDDNVMKAEASALAAKAVKGYDAASGAGLRTWVTRNLLGLSRIKRRVNSTLSLPERTQLDGAALERSRLEFVDANGRDPDIVELSDRTGLPIKRIEFIRKSNRLSPAEGVMESAQPHVMSDFSQEAASYMMNDLPHIDRRIMEMKMGFAGHPVLPAHEIAARLKLSPAGLSRRSMSLALRLHQAEEDLRSVYGTST